MQKPIARFTMAASTGQKAKENEQLSLTVPKGQTVHITFSADNSYDPDGGSIRSYEWRISGTFVASNSRFEFDLGVGRHDIFLMVTDDEGQTGAVGATIVITEDTSINNPPIISSLIYEPRNPTPDDTIYFEVLASDPDGDPLRYEWYLNGVKQTNATAAKVQWANPSEGNYTMMVVVYDNKGSRSEVSINFTVQKKSSQAPQITSVKFPSTITINTPTEGQINFYDPEGDINWIRIEHFTNGIWRNIGEGDPNVYGYTQGRINFTITCDSLGPRTHRIILRDANGNVSVPYEYSFECVKSGPPPPPVQPIDSDNDGIPDNQDQCPYQRGPAPTGCPDATKPPVARFTIGGESLLGEYRTASENETLYLDYAHYDAGVRVDFSARNSFDPDGTIVQYEWFINGTLVSRSRDFSFILDANQHLVLLRVTDNTGLQSEVGATIIVEEVVVLDDAPWLLSLKNTVGFTSVQVYSVQGKLIYQFEEIPPHKRWQWNMRDQYGARVPNGVYLAVITVRDLSGYPIRREVRKIVVLR
jgi:hypothetical protein